MKIPTQLPGIPLAGDQTDADTLRGQGQFFRASKTVSPSERLIVVRVP